MHGHQLQVIFRRHDVAGGSGLGKQVKPGNREIRPAQVQSHDPGKHHPHKYGHEGQRVVLLADYFVVETEDVLPDETLRRGVVCRMCRYVVHRIYLNPEYTCLQEFDHVRSGLLQRRLLLHPIVKIFLRIHGKIGLHVVVPQSAKLGTDDFVPADLGGSEMNREIQSRNEVLLHPQLRNIKRMSDILRMHQQMNIAVHWNRHFSGHNVIFGILIVGLIKTKKVFVGLVNHRGMERTELPVRAGIAEVKRKLPGLHLNRQRHPQPAE